MRRLTTALFAAAMAAAALASPAASQEGDAYSQDPDSPGGSQYQIPSEQVRGDLGGGSGGDGNGQRGGESPRFGEGIEPTGGDQGQGGSNGGQGGDGGDDSGGAAGASGSGDGGDSGGSAESASGSGEGSVGGTSGSSDSPGTIDDLATSSSDSPVNAPTLAITFAVLLAGAAVGLFLRRRRSF